MATLDWKIFGVLFFSLFTAVTGVGIVVPLLPVYAHDMGASGFAIGLIFGSFSLSRTFSLSYFGKKSDKNGRRPYIVSGLLAYTFISLAFMLSSSVTALIIIRFIQGIASAMMMPVIQAYVGDITPQGREGTTMGLFNVAMFFGLSLGPVLGGYIHDLFSLDAAFFCMGILAGTSFLLSICLLPPTRSEKVVIAAARIVPWRELMVDRSIIGQFTIRFAYAACIGVIWGFLPVLATTDLRLSSSTVGFLVMIGIFISGVLHVPMGRLADRTNKNLLVIIGGLIGALGVFLFNWATSFEALLAANILFGVGGGIATPALMALVVIKGNEHRAMGSIMSLLTMGHSLGMLTGSMAAGLMMDLAGLRQAFLLGGILMTAAVILFVFCTEKNRRP
ncbi:MAG: MFS transporter [Desulfobacterales bacterium]|nr:MFS transporter [Desulfobacterales bacterium]